MNAFVRIAALAGATMLVGFAAAKLAPAMLGLEVVSRPAMAAAVSGGVAVLVATRPTLGVWIGALVPTAELVAPGGTWRLAGFMVLTLTVILAWPAAGQRPRRIALLVMALGTWTCLNGLVFAAHGPQSSQIAVGVAYSVMVAACASLVRLQPASVWLLLISWGGIAGYAVLSTPGLISDRSQTLLGENANSLGLLCALGLTSSLALFLIRKRVVLVTIFAALFCGLGLVSTGSRGAFLALVASLLTLALAPVWRSTKVRAAVVAAVAVALFVICAPPLIEWFLNEAGRLGPGQSSFVSRRAALMAAIKVGNEHLLSGVGLGRLGLVDSGNAFGLRAHNVFAGIFAESGLISIGLFLALVWLAISRSRTLPSAGLLITVVCVIVGGLSVEWWGTARLAPLCMMLLAHAAAQPVNGREMAVPEKPDARGTVDLALDLHRSEARGALGT